MWNYERHPVFRNFRSPHIVLVKGGLNDYTNIQMINVRWRFFNFGGKYQSTSGGNQYLVVIVLPNLSGKHCRWCHCLEQTQRLSWSYISQPHFSPQKTESLMFFCTLISSKWQKGFRCHPFFPLKQDLEPVTLFKYTF